MQGLTLSGSTEATAHYDRALDHLVRFQIEVVEAQASARAADPRCAMAGVFGAYLSLMSTEAASVADARDALAGIAGDPGTLTPREQAHVAAAGQWVAGDMAGAGAILADVSLRWPRDLLALFVGHQIDFFTGDAVSLRDRIGRALWAWTPDDPNFGVRPGHVRLRARGVQPVRAVRGRGPGRRRDQSRRRLGYPRHGPHLRDAGSDRPGRRVHARPPRGLGHGELPQGPQLVALRALPAPGGRRAGRAGGLRPGAAPRRLRGRGARAARRVVPALAPPPRGRGGRRSLAVVGSGLGPPADARVLPVQRRARRDGVHRCRGSRARPRARRGPRSRRREGRP